MLLDPLKELEPRHLKSVHTCNQMLEELRRFRGELRHPLIHRFAQRRGQFRGRTVRRKRPHVLLELGAVLGKMKILNARQQPARQAVARIERMPRDVAKGGNVRRGPEFEFRGRELFHGHRGIFANRAPAVENVFDSYHVHIVAKRFRSETRLVIMEAGSKMKLPHRRSTLAVLFAGASSAITSGISTAAQQRGGVDSPPRPGDPPEDVKLPNGKSQRDEILKSERDRNVKDAAELVDLAQQLQQDIEKNDVFVFSIATLKKTDDIEKLVKKIRGRLRHN